MLSIHVVQGRDSRDYAEGNVDFTAGEGMGALDDYLREQYSGFYDINYGGYHGNHSTSAAVNHLLEELDSSEQISEFEPVETEFGENDEITRLEIALTPDALDALRASLDASPYETSTRFGSPLQSHFRRVVQSYAVELTDYELPNNDD